MARTHRLSRTKEYYAWTDAKRRCTNDWRPEWPRYGGRGITVCREWSDSFLAFLRDMGPCPPGGMLDRIDNDRGYEPGNCRWADRLTQNNNKPRFNRPLTFDGRTMNVEQWTRELGFPPVLIRKRLWRGWSVERALTTPPVGRAESGRNGALKRWHSK